MIRRDFVGTVFRLTLTVCFVSSCAQSEQKPTGKLADTLPTVVASVNGAKIERAKVLERLAQVRSMLAHQQHMAQMDQKATQRDLQPGASTASSPSPASTHAQHDSTEDEKTILRSVINLMVLEQLKMQEVERLGLRVSSDVLEHNIKTIERQAGSREALEEQLRQGHTTVDQWRDQLRLALLFQQLADQRRKALPVSDEEVSRYWTQNHRTLAKIWNTDRLDHVRDRVRDLIQQARWPQAEAEWHNELVRQAKIWVDPAVRRQLADPPDHAHPGQAGGPANGPAGRG